jgi:hypothetical protein
MHSPLDPAESTRRAKGFLASLFDFSFVSFITPKLIRLLYLLGLLAGVVISIAAITAAFNVTSALGVLTLFLSPLIFLVTLAYTRVALELVAIAFRMEEHLRRLP